MKIAILTPTFNYYSGIDRVVEQQALELFKNNKVTVFALESEIKPKTFKVRILGMPNSGFMQRIYRLLFFLDRRKIKKTAHELRDYDLIISHFYPMNLIAGYAKKKYGIKYQYHNHGIGYSKLFSNPLERFYMFVFGFLNRLSLKNVDSAVSISKFMQKELKRETGLDSKVVYDKIDGKKFNTKVDGGRIRKKLSIAEDEKLLLFIGRLSPHKNIHTLLKIFCLVSKSNPKSKLLIVGKPTFPSYFKRLKLLANNNVIFKSFIEDKELPEYYAACDVYVTASLWEGFNLPAAEAQACGKKVVAFDIGPHPEVVKNGRLAKKNDVYGFAKAVIRILNE